LTVILHTLNALPTSSAFDDCLRVAAAGDAILLLGDGVYAAIDDTRACSKLLASGADIHILSPDAQAAGVCHGIERFTLVDMEGFVELTERYPRQQAWY